VQQLSQGPALGVKLVALRPQVREMDHAAACLLRQADDVLGLSEPPQRVLCRPQLPRQNRRLLAQEGRRAPGLRLLRILAVGNETGHQQIGHGPDQLRVGPPVGDIHEVRLPAAAVDRERVLELLDSVIEIGNRERDRPEPQHLGRQLELNPPERCGRPSHNLVQQHSGGIVSQLEAIESNGLQRVPSRRRGARNPDDRKDLRTRHAPRRRDLELQAERVDNVFRQHPAAEHFNLRADLGASQAKRAQGGNASLPVIDPERGRRAVRGSSGLDVE
jgi:hypothetical protein